MTTSRFLLCGMIWARTPHRYDYQAFIAECFPALWQATVQIHFHCRQGQGERLPAKGPAPPPLVVAESREQVAGFAAQLARQQPFRFFSLLGVEVDVLMPSYVEHTFHELPGRGACWCMRREVDRESLLNSGFAREIERRVRNQYSSNLKEME